MQEHLKLGDVIACPSCENSSQSVGMHDTCIVNTLFEEVCMKFMEEIMQIGLISKRKHHFVIIGVSLS
jgi:hypothetical protein